MTWNRYEPPLELRAALRQWQQQSGALSALPDAPVQPIERPGPLARAARAVRRATGAVLDPSRVRSRRVRPVAGGPAVRSRGGGAVHRRSSGHDAGPAVSRTALPTHASGTGDGGSCAQWP